MTQILPAITFIIFAVCGYWLFFGLPSYKSTAWGTQSVTGRVKYVVDGDSLYIGSHKPQVRLWGVNTPEIGERGYNAAKSQLEILTAGVVVTCQVMHRDKYGRTVGRCYLPDGQDIGRVLLNKGLAHEMRGFSKGYYSR